jgi:PAS domain S-box-containing protein
MTDDERLREALLELQILRAREARALEDTRTLLACLEAFSSAATPSAALSALFDTLSDRIGASRCAMITKAEDGAVVTASDAADWVGATLGAPIDLFQRPRDVSDLALLGDWTGGVDLSGHAGLIVAPVGQDTALIVLRRSPGAFRKGALGLVERVAGLAAQALKNRALAAQNTLLAATISGSSSGFAIADATDPARPLIYVNAAFERLSGYTAEEVLGQNCRFLSAEAPDAPERRRLARAVRSGNGGTFLLRNRRKSGGIFWNELTLFPVHDAEGQVQNLVATQSDVTERVEAEAERDRARARMEAALDATDDAFLVLDADGRIAFANGAVDVLFPAPGQHWAQGSAFAANWEAYLSGARDLPGRLTSLLGRAGIAALTELAAHQSGREIDLPDGRSVLIRVRGLGDGGLVVSATDVTAMKTAQNLLAQRLAAIEAAGDGIAITDDAGRLIYLNSAAAGLMRFSTAESGLGQRWRDQYRGTGRTQPGEGFAVTLRLGEATHEITGSPLESGGSVIVIRDITPTLDAEAREAETMRELIRLQRQEAVAQLSAGIAHDFNNLLSAINGSATLIEMVPDLPTAVQPHLERIKAAGAQSTRLVSRLLDLGADRDSTGAFELSSVLCDLPALLQPSLGAGTRFEIAAADHAMALRGAGETLTQILINLALNARDALGQTGGTITLRVDAVAGTDHDGPLAVGSLAPAQRYARLAMKDTGAGMDDDTAANIFRPYFTTKGRQGTGLGLAMAAMQVSSVGGAAALDTAPGRGTTVTIFWPMAAVARRDVVRGSGAAQDLDGQTLILVDDDAAVAGVIAAYLEARGAEVAVCHDPQDAAAAVEEDPGDWSALITDYDMTEMNGGALAERVRAAAPALPIVVVTALARRLNDPRLDAAGVAAILPKPVDLESLAATLAACAAKGRTDAHSAC